MPDCKTSARTIQSFIRLFASEYFNSLEISWQLVATDGAPQTCRPTDRFPACGSRMHAPMISFTATRALVTTARMRPHALLKPMIVKRSRLIWLVPDHNVDVNDERASMWNFQSLRGHVQPGRSRLIIDIRRTQLNVKPLCAHLLQQTTPKMVDYASYYFEAGIGCRLQSTLAFLCNGRRSSEGTWNVRAKLAES